MPFAYFLLDGSHTNERLGVSYPEPRYSAKTDANGRFRIPLCAQYATGNRNPYPLVLGLPGRGCGGGRATGSAGPRAVSPDRDRYPTAYRYDHSGRGPRWSSPRQSRDHAGHRSRASTRRDSVRSCGSAGEEGTQDGPGEPRRGSTKSRSTHPAWAFSGWAAASRCRGPTADCPAAPVGAIEGRLIANANLEGVTVNATTILGGYEGSGYRGLAEATCDRRAISRYPRSPPAAWFSISIFAESKSILCFAVHQIRRRRGQNAGAVDSA